MADGVALDSGPFAVVGAGPARRGWGEGSGQLGHEGGFICGGGVGRERKTEVSESEEEHGCGRILHWRFSISLTGGERMRERESGSNLRLERKKRKAGPFQGS